MSEDKGTANDLQNILGRIPEGVKLNPPQHQFHPDLQASLDQAAKSDGKYLIVVFNYDDSTPDKTVHMRVIRGKSWPYDLFLRAVGMLKNFAFNQEIDS